MTLHRTLLAAHRALVRALLPGSFRRRHGPELDHVFRSRLAGAGARSGARGMLKEAGREAAGLVRLAVTLRRDVRAAGGRTRRREVTEMTGNIVQDARLAGRTLLRSPVTTAVMVLTLALGIGANAAVFSLVDGVLLNTLPYEEPDEVMFVGQLTESGDRGQVAYENFRDWQRQAPFFEEVAAFVGNSVAVTGQERPERIRGLFVSASYFDLIGIEPTLGRAIAPGEDEPGGPRTAVLSHGFWQRRYGADPGVLGRSIVLNNEVHTIVGVMPADFVPVWDLAEAWISLHTVPRELDRSARSLMAMARLADGVDPDRAREDFEALAARLAEAHPDANAGQGAWLTPLGPVLSANHRPLLLTLLAAVGMVLAVACANLAAIQLARAEARRREMAVRSALGGSRGRLASQLLVESLVLAALGGSLGLLAAWGGVELLLDLLPSYRQYFAVELSRGALLLASALTVGTGVAFGVIPAVAASRPDVADTLGEGSRGASDGPRGGRVRAVLVSGQLALAVVLLVGAGLLVRSLASLSSVDTGFDTEGLLTLEFRLPANRYVEDEDVVAFLDRTLAEVESVPGVEAAAAVRALPFSGNGGFGPFLREGQSLDDAGSAPELLFNQVSPGYFDVMGIELLAGRAIEGTDRPGTPAVAVVSRSLARRVAGEGDPLGIRFYYTEELDVATIVGVAADVRDDLTGGPVDVAYLSYAHDPSRFTSLAVRTRGADAMAVADGVRRAVWTVDADQPVWEVMPIEERIAGSIGDRRFVTVVLAAFAAAALLLACLGIYGAMAHAVGRRTRELGVRLALGADRRQVVALVLRRGLALTMLGLALGVGGALALTRFLEASLFGVAARDPATFLAAPAILAVVALLACWLPARRAAGIDPVRSLSDG